MTADVARWLGFKTDFFHLYILYLLSESDIMCCNSSHTLVLHVAYSSGM